MSSPIFDEGLALYHSIQMSEKIGGALQVGATQKGVPHIRVDIRCFCACKYFIKKKNQLADVFSGQSHRGGRPLMTCIAAVLCMIFLLQKCKGDKTQQIYDTAFLFLFASKPIRYGF